MIKIMEYYAARGFQKSEYSRAEMRNRVLKIPVVHRLSFLTSFDVEIDEDELTLLTDITPGLHDYLTKSGIFKGYNVS